MIRKYADNTITNYRSAILSLLRWSGLRPRQIDRNLVREYLEYMVDGGAGASQLGVHLSAIRTVFDKMCYRDITLGLETPRRSKKLPIVLSKDEIQRLLEAAVSLRDKMLLGLMYATGMRCGEVVKVRWQDVDFGRNVIRIVQGKGNVDREVMLPDSFRQLFRSLSNQAKPTDFLFPTDGHRSTADCSARHLTTRTVQRVVERTLEIAHITKRATPHSLRHSFATHSFEDGCDIRRIQKVLVHVQLETTTIYVKVARPADPSRMSSPIDRLAKRQSNPSIPEPRVNVHANEKLPNWAKVHVRQFAGEASIRGTLEISHAGQSVFFTGIRITEPRRGFWTLSLPPTETWAAQKPRISQTQGEAMQKAEFYRLLSSAFAAAAQQQLSRRVAC